MSTAGKCCHGSLRAGRWAVPAALLIFMPKCPACFAGYLALATGIGITFSAATWIRAALIVTCFATLLWLVLRAVRARYYRGAPG